VRPEESAFANHCLIFEIAVIVAGDGSGADIAVFANFGIADVT
jgi:hypothetical protein